MILQTSVKIYLFFCKIVITESLTVCWGVLFELLLLGGFRCRGPTSAVQLVVMKWTEHPPPPPYIFPCGMGSTTTLPTCLTSGLLISKLDALFLLFFFCFFLCRCSAKIYRQQAIGRCPHLEFYHKVALLTETALSSEENLLLVVSLAAASQLFDKNTCTQIQKKKSKRSFV